MPRDREDTSDNASWLGRLDELIEHYFGVLIGREDENIKLGDWIKMVELRHKLAPGGADQKRFWEMVEEIRQSNGGKSKAASKRSKPSGDGKKKK